MPDSANDPGERTRQFAAIRDHARQAVVGLARCRGTEFATRPVQDSDLTMRDLEPLTGARAARDIELGAHHTARDYIRQARETGHSWDQIGQALGVTPNADTDQTGLSVAEAAYTYAAGSAHTDAAVRYGRSFVWRCRSCDQVISDRGLIAGPADDEPGHTSACPRLAAAVAEWNAGWEAEP
ncbi:MAG TPA: hypothetical protein VGF32_06645 [Streptosporangiaceae bacterium]|jgi:hypothetical protein